MHLCMRQCTAPWEAVSRKHRAATGGDLHSHSAVVVLYTNAVRALSVGLKRV